MKKLFLKVENDWLSADFEREFGGETGIRTQGARRHNGFRV